MRLGKRSISEMNIPASPRGMFRSRVRRTLAALENLTDPQGAEQIPTFLAGETRPCVSGVVPEQAPEQ